MTSTPLIPTEVTPLRASYLQVCQVVALINAVTGGPAYSVTQLAQFLSRFGWDSHLFTLNYPKLGPQVIPDKVTVHSYDTPLVGRLLRGWHPSAGRALIHLAQDMALIHNHGLWMFPNLYARQAATRRDCPLVISPRGMLETWSLGRSRFRKALAWYGYERENLACATLFHVTSEAEAQSVRALGLKQPIALIPNGVDLPDPSQIPPNPDCLTDRFPHLAGRPWLVFLSRIHPKKGLDTLLTVWADLVKRFPDWHLILAGPDLVGYQPLLERQVQQLNLGEWVTFTGPLSGQDKAAALAHAHLFVLPSHSENFGIAVAEALAYGVPVVTTRGTPWAELETHGCGWWVENRPADLEAALADGMALPGSERRAMGARGQQLVHNRYGWPVIAQQMSEVYLWLLQGGWPPACLVA